MPIKTLFPRIRVAFVGVRAAPVCHGPALRDCHGWREWFKPEPRARSRGIRTEFT
jgi:hypothetical protein